MPHKNHMNVIISFNYGKNTVEGIAEAEHAWLIKHEHEQQTNKICYRSVTVTVTGY